MVSIVKSAKQYLPETTFYYEMGDKGEIILNPNTYYMK